MNAEPSWMVSFTDNLRGDYDFLREYYLWLSREGGSTILPLTVRYQKLEDYSDGLVRDRYQIWRIELNKSAMGAAEVSHFSKYVGLALPRYGY